MGLDNIPFTYACRNAGTAVQSVDERIDCDATMAAGGCPWQEAARGRGTPVTGMLGTPCWYRGKVGSWMLEDLIAAGYDDAPGGIEGFYGTSPDTPEGEPDLTPEHCAALAGWLEDHAEAYAALLRADGGGERAKLDEYRYAAWWLRFVAERCGGAAAWW